MAVTGQPSTKFGMELGGGPGGAALPPALAYLASVDQLIVKQKKEMLEILTGFETANRYEVYNNMNQQVFFVAEESSTCERCFFPNIRSFQLHVLDNNSQEVMRISRDFLCCKGCCWCAEGSCGVIQTIEAPVGHPVGYIRQKGSKWKPHYGIFDNRDQHLFTIWGPCCPCQAVCCTDDVEFPITTNDLKTRVGMIAKQWRGVCVETITDADQFSVTFPMDMAVETKALFIGALFMVDYLVFETQKNNNNK